MKGLFGCVHHSSCYVYDVFDKYVPGKVRFYDDADVSKAKIVIVDDFEYFRRKVQKYNEQKVVVVLVSSPLMLGEVKGLVLLDVSKRTQTYSFKLCPMDKSLILKAVTLAKKDHPSIQVDIQRIDAIAQSIVQEKHEGFLHLYNLFVLRSLGNANTSIVKKALLGYLFGELSIKEMDKTISKELGSGKAFRSYQDLKAVMLKATALQNALSYIKQNPKDDVNKVAKKFKQDAYDLRYLKATWIKETAKKPRTIKKVIHDTLDSWRKDKKEGSRKVRALSRLDGL